MEKPVMDQVIIEIEVKGVPEPILNPQILAFFRIKIPGTLFLKLMHIVTVIHRQVWCVSTGRIWSALRLPDGSRA